MFYETEFKLIRVEIKYKLPFSSERNEVLKEGGPWPAKRQRVEALYRNMGLLCCVSRPNPNYL